MGRARDTSRALSYSKSLYRAVSATSPRESSQINRNTSNFDIKQTGGIVKSYYIRVNLEFKI